MCSVVYDGTQMLGMNVGVWELQAHILYVCTAKLVLKGEQTFLSSIYIRKGLETT